MSKYIPGNQKHLALEDRAFIEHSLNHGHSFKYIAKYLCKDPTPISKRSIAAGWIKPPMSVMPDFFTEMDTVHSSHESRKTLLTFYFTREKLFLAFLMNRCTKGAVRLVFDHLENRLGTYDFLSLFEYVLTDRGSEFGNSEALETGTHDFQRCSLYYCDPMRSGQKGGVENAHTMLRMVLPKGTSFEFLTTCRCGELIGLTWSDIDMKNKIVNINHQLVYKNYGNGCQLYISPPKTDSGNRCIPMRDSLYEAFKEQRKLTMMLGRPSNVEIEGYKNFVFTAKTGRPLVPSAVNNVLYNIVDAINREETENAESEHRKADLLPEINTECCGAA